MKNVLTLGGNNTAIPLASRYAWFEHLLLDKGPQWDARQGLAWPGLTTQLLWSGLAGHIIHLLYGSLASTTLTGFGGARLWQ